MSLIVQDLTKRYGDKVVVDHLSFRMDQPGVYALLGSNGAGKTTSIRMMLGILARDGGTVLWNDRPLNTDTCNVGYLAEERGVPACAGNWRDLQRFWQKPCGGRFRVCCPKRIHGRKRICG